ncbi:hypothetical protein ACFQZ4_26285 [Catellatospora coxensis]
MTVVETVTVVETPAGVEVTETVLVEAEAPVALLAEGEPAGQPGEVAHADDEGRRTES